jgi:leucyl aminopeptidase (aminopeptidase T)
MTLFIQHELQKAAWNLASDNVRAGENVLVVSSSDQSMELVDAIVTAAAANDASTVSAAIIACPSDLKDYTHPPPIIAAVKAADLTIVATTLRFPRAYDDLSEALFASGKRQVLINNAPLDDFTRGASLADPLDLHQRTHSLATKISDSTTVRVSSPNGTDLQVGVCRPCLALTGRAEEDTGFGSFPSGEAMLSPEEGSAKGIFVADSFGQVVYLSGSGPQLGTLEDPIRMEFSKGVLSKIEGGKAADRLKSILEEADENALQLGELGLGTNPLAREIGHVENKFRIGTAHIALGDNHLIGWRGASIYGGTIVSNRHIDLVSNNITISTEKGVIIP